MASHTDRDHLGALGWVAERWPPELWAGALPAHLDERLAHAAARLDITQGALELPVSGRARGALTLTLLRGVEEGGNEGSRSLLVEYGEHRALLCGDAEGHGLEAMLRLEAMGGPVDLLLFPHHGSRTPLLGALLEATSPALVWVSCSGRPPVAAELDGRGVPWRGTGQGALALDWPYPGRPMVRVR